MKIFVLGLSSWIGHFLIGALKKVEPSVEIVGSYRNTIPILKDEAKRLYSNDFQQTMRFIEEFRPSAVLNLARGEDGTAFELHQKIIAYSNRHQCYYSYVSSSNAVDANYLNFHDEDEPGHGQTDYGKFKAQCEAELRETCKNFSILRFSAVHGWSPYGERRTTNMLRELKTEGKFTAPTEVLQNQIVVTYLAAMMAGVVLKQGQGTFHLGPTDYMDHFEFVRELAKAFGYDADQIIPGEKKPFNMVMRPKRIFELLGDNFKMTVAYTIKALASMEELEIYRKT